MRKTWTDQGWEDYLCWQTQDRKTLRRINDLVKDIERNGLGAGIGKPEPLRGDLQGFWSRRIDEKNRIVYGQVERDALCILACRGHYGD
ncbi:MAG: Txe/YoeB family addiction module toxin [Kiritimatiellae bacterium]|nr:Txe/YoeB family addiction module toxin [Kiritimatiellia bacterium]